MRAKKKAVKRNPREFKAWALVDARGRWIAGWHTHPALYANKRIAQSKCLYADGERVIRVRITEVVK